MVKRVPVALLVLAVVVMAALAGFVLTGRPELDRTRDRVDRQWVALRPPLDARYAKLGAFSTVVRNTLGEDRTPIRDTRVALAKWQRLRGARAARSTDEVAAANVLEGDAARLKAMVDASARLHDNNAVRDAMTAFDTATIEVGRRAYDQAVHDYEHARRGLVRRLATALLGYGARPVFESGATTTA